MTLRLLYTFITILGRALNLAILARILLTWMPIGRQNRLVRVIYEITEPILAPIRRVVPSIGGLDLSPMIAILLVEMVQRILVRLLLSVG